MIREYYSIRDQRTDDFISAPISYQFLSLYYLVNQHINLIINHNVEGYKLSSDYLSQNSGRRRNLSYL